MKKQLCVIATSLLLILFSCNGQTQTKNTSSQKPTSTMKEEINKTDEEWKKTLTPEQYQILRQKGTERPYTGKYEKHHEKGMYVCAACGNELFASDTKFDAECGWPSFFQSLDSTKVKTQRDFSLGMVRTEIMCAKCGGHLGHVFDDGPKPTGLRYCVNSVSLDFKAIQKK